MTDDIHIHTPSFFPDLVEPKRAALPMRERAEYRVMMDPEACNLTELLSTLIGGKNPQETAEALVTRFGSVHEINRAQVEELRKAGLTKATATRLKAAMAIGRRLMGPQEAQVIVQSPREAFIALRPYLVARSEEYMFMLSLNTRHVVLAADEITHGSLDSASVRIADIFKIALGHNANCIVLGHNHPSGNPRPSQEDVNITKCILAASKLMDVLLLDHIVIGDGENFVSMKEMQLGF